MDISPSNNFNPYLLYYFLHFLLSSTGEVITISIGSESLEVYLLSEALVFVEIDQVYLFALYLDVCYNMEIKANGSERLYRPITRSVALSGNSFYVCLWIFIDN